MHTWTNCTVVPQVTFMHTSVMTRLRVSTCPRSIITFDSIQRRVSPTPVASWAGFSLPSGCGDAHSLRGAGDCLQRPPAPSTDTLLLMSPCQVKSGAVSAGARDIDLEVELEEASLLQLRSERDRRDSGVGDETVVVHPPKICLRTTTTSAKASGC